MGFEKEDDFIGDVFVKDVRCSIEELFVRAGNIRKRLGKQAYLLDRYLSYLMESANKTLAYDSSSEGFDRFSELRGMCRDIIRGEKTNTDRPFFEQAENFIETNPLGCMEVQTKVSLYTAMLSGYYLEDMASKFYRGLRSDLASVLDIIDFRQVYGRICEQLGNEEEMKHIDQLFRKCFLIVTPMACYLQGMANGLLYEFTTRDRESSRMIFQLLLDRMP